MPGGALTLLGDPHTHTVQAPGVVLTLEEIGATLTPLTVQPCRVLLVNGRGHNAFI